MSLNSLSPGVLQKLGIQTTLQIKNQGVGGIQRGGNIWKQPGRHSAQDCATGNKHGDRRQRGDGTDIGKVKIPVKHVPPQIRQAQIWGADNLVKRLLCKTADELYEESY